VVDIIPVLLDAIIQVLMGLVAILPDLIVTIVDALVALIPVLLQGAMQLFVAIAQALPIVILQIIDMLPDLIASVAEMLIANQGPMTVAAVELFMALVTALPEILLALQTLFPKIIEALIPAIQSGGEQMVQGLMEGFADAWPRMMKNVQDMLNRLWKSFLEFFDIHSPSRLMADTVGFQIGAGVGEGIEESIGTALKSVNAFQNGIYAEFEDGSFELLASSDMDGGNGSSSAPAQVVQNIYAQRPKDLRDQANAMKRGTISGINTLRD